MNAASLYATFGVSQVRLHDAGLDLCPTYTAASRLNTGATPNTTYGENIGVMAATLTVFVRPAFEAYLAVRDRADLAAQAGHALARMQADVRAAVPNSIRTPAANCIEMLPTRGGGRYRRPACLRFDRDQPKRLGMRGNADDIRGPVPAPGDFVVVDNQNPGDVYAGSNRAAIGAVAVPAAAYGRHRITVAATAFPAGYDGGRFVVVPASQRAVFYVCSGADGTLDANGNGRGTLVRLSSYGFNAAYPAACPATAGGAVLATLVRSCRFVYDPNQGATQQNGFVSLQLELARHGETASLVFGAHVLNTP